MSNSTNELEKQVKELTNLGRLIANTLNLVNDMEIKGAYAPPVAEVISWLTQFEKSVKDQRTALEDQLPKPVIEAEVAQP